MAKHFPQAGLHMLLAFDPGKQVSRSQSLRNRIVKMHFHKTYQIHHSLKTPGIAVVPNSAYKTL